MQKKVLLSLAVLSVSTVTLADDSSLSSLSYRVKANEFHYNLGMEFATLKNNASSVDSLATGAAIASNIEKESFESTNTTWTNDFSYGLNDSLSFGLGLDLVLSSKRNQTAGSAGTTIKTGSSTTEIAGKTFGNLDEKNNGLKNIRLNTSYRYLNDTVKADLLGQFTISGKAKRATSNEDVNSKYVVSEGDAKTGGSSLQVGTQFSGAMGSFEWATDLGLDYQMKKKITFVGGDVDSANKVINYEQETKSKLDFALGVAGQFNLTPEFSLGANLGLDLISKEESTASVINNDPADVKTNVTKTYKGYTDITLGLNSKYVVTPNMMLGLNYSHVFGADIDGTQSAKQVGSPASNNTLTMTDRKDDRFGFDVSVRF